MRSSPCLKSICDVNFDTCHEVPDTENARSDEFPTPKKPGQAMRPVHAVDVPYDGVGATGHRKQQNTVCKRL